MNKSERLNDMMLYLNDKNSFNLKDLMNHYNISKSTALRDIESLERIGMPLYSQSGRNGYYGILRNRLLSPIVFTIDELFALYFSMLTLRAYETTPFHLSVEKLKEKFEHCLSADKIEMLRRVERVFSLASIKHYNHCYFLSDVLQYTIDEKVCKVKYLKKDTAKYYYVQFYNISSTYGQWYATGLNFELNVPQVFRCDKILDIEVSSLYSSKPLSEIIKSPDIMYRTNDSTNYEVKISKAGVDLFHKEHYPSMKLFMENDQYFIRGFYNNGEEHFITSYFIGYGEHILSIQPISLKNLVLKKLDDLKKHFLDI